MKKYHEIKNITISKDKLKLSIDGKEYEFPLASISQKLISADVNQKNNFKVSHSGYGIHWPMIDEDISIDGLLKHKIVTGKRKQLS
jgi:hypothetical protein